MILPLREAVSAFCDIGGYPHIDVELPTYERLLLLVAPYGWTPMLTAAEDGGYRAWLRHTDGRRMFGRPADTAEGATLALIAKVERWAS